MLDQLILSTRKKKEITIATTKLLYYDATATRQGWGGETAPLSFHPALSQKFLCQITFHLIKLRPTDPNAGGTPPMHGTDPWSPPLFQRRVPLLWLAAGIEENGRQWS